MSKRTTFFAVDRKLLEEELWLAEPFSKGQAWIDLIGRASYADTELTKRGELLISERSIAKRWKWSRGKVSRFLDFLEKEGMIKRTTNRSNNRATYGTTLRIEKYEEYQNPRATNRATNRASDKAIYNNINNINKNLSLMTDEETVELLQAYSPEALADLEMDVRSYYENNPDKTFPGWVKAIRQFDRNQKRWRAGQPGQPKKRKKTTEDLIKELQEEEQQ